MRVYASSGCDIRFRNARMIVEIKYLLFKHEGFIKVGMNNTDETTSKNKNRESSWNQTKAFCMPLGYSTTDLEAA